MVSRRDEGKTADSPRLMKPHGPGKQPKARRSHGAARRLARSKDGKGSTNLAKVRGGIERGGGSVMRTWRGSYLYGLMRSWMGHRHSGQEEIALEHWSQVMLCLHG